ncbi:MAG: hypothetical protein HY791_29565 [Deltaproteobacteria bacterium]|nr:hypothetical protein [Deltaproteobacteria bacterium]
MKLGTLARWSGVVKSDRAKLDASFHPGKTLVVSCQARRLATALAGLIACGRGGAGTGSVQGELEILRCRASETFGPEAYGFDAGRLSTDRFDDVLLIVIAEHGVELEETDGLLIRVPGAIALSAKPERPIVLPLSRDPEVTNAALSLFQTCPTRPTLFTTSGSLVLDRFTINPKPEDAGDGEVIAGTLTASVASADADRNAGWIRAEFDFLPPSRLLRDVPDQ